MKSIYKISLAAMVMALASCKENKSANNKSGSSDKTEQINKASIYTFHISEDNPVKNFNLKIHGSFSEECNEINKKINWVVSTQNKSITFNKNGNANCKFFIENLEFSNQDNNNEIYKMDDNLNLIWQTEIVKFRPIYLKDNQGKIHYQISLDPSKMGNIREYKISKYEEPKISDYKDPNIKEDLNNNVYKLFSNVSNIKFPNHNITINSTIEASTNDFGKMISYKGAFEISETNNKLIKSYKIVETHGKSNEEINNLILNKGMTRSVNATKFSIDAWAFSIAGNLPMSYNKNENPNDLIDEQLKNVSIILYVENDTGKEVGLQIKSNVK